MTTIPTASLATGNAITPLDGRNYHKISDLSNYFSESALTRYRIMVEVEYLIGLANWQVIDKLNGKDKQKLRSVYEKFDLDGYQSVKNYEAKTNHDIKSVEYFIREKLTDYKLNRLHSFVHFGLTSEDINNLAYALMLRDFKNVLIDEIVNVMNQIHEMAKQNKKIPMLARTHGQPAVTTTVGKELANYYHRLSKLKRRLKAFKFEGKLNGAVGNLNAHKTILPKKNWLKLTRDFVEQLGLVANQYTTQILFYDNIAEFFQIVYLMNAILIDLSINIWQWIMLLVFVQIKKDNEVGSSTMPQKINPINFEHAEGNLQLANSLIEFFVRKLTHSRLQRDLSDSTVRRNFGEALGYGVLGWRSLSAGLKKLRVNEGYLRDELNQHWEILGEALQTALRLKNDKQAYEKLKAITRGKIIDKHSYQEILKELSITDKNMIDLTPEKYLGYAVELVDTMKRSD